MCIRDRFRILTEGAKYDVSCASSGVTRKSSAGTTGLTNRGGVCHTFTADGRCVSLIKVFLTNNCIYNCRYCVNRSGADVERAMFTPQELCDIIMDFYKRNYIEGLFLSSAVFRSPDYTMELMIQTVEKLRNEYGFNGYIHLKGIPSCDSKLIDKAASLVDRISLNIELPSNKGLKMLAPDKKSEGIVQPMKQLSQLFLAQKKGEFGGRGMIPGGQSKQMKMCIRDSRRKTTVFFPLPITCQRYLRTLPRLLYFPLNMLYYPLYSFFRLFRLIYLVPTLLQNYRHYIIQYRNIYLPPLPLEDVRTAFPKKLQFLKTLFHLCRQPL